MSPLPIDLRAGAVAPYARLIAELDDLADRGHLAPCRKQPHLWVSDSREDREAAAWRCSACPALDACHDYAERQGERFGVWAGHDRTGSTPGGDDTAPLAQPDRRRRPSGKPYRPARPHRRRRASNQKPRRSA